MSEPDLLALDALDLAAAVRRREIEPRDLVRRALRRIARHNPRLDAVVASLAGPALAAAETVDRDAPFAGVPTLIKDFLAQVAGTPTTAGARAFADAAPATVDSETVARLRAAGLLIVGKSNTPEMAISASTEPALFGPTRNPYDPARSAGGSSGGAAAAVAAGLVPVAHATDGGGSIRIPAAACGLVGLKTSRGRISMAPLGESLAGGAVEGVLTRTVRDSAALVDVLAGNAPGDPYAAPALHGPLLAETGRPTGRLRIALSLRPPYPCAIDEDCRAAALAAARLLSDLGHRVEEADPPIDEGELDHAFLVAMSVNIANAIALRGEGRAFSADDFEPVTWAMIERGRALSGIDYVRATQAFHRLGRTVAPFFRRHDLLLTPTLATLPPLLGHLDTRTADLDGFLRRLFSFAPFTRPWNATGQPAISLPLHWTASGLPVGVQFVARYGDEATLVRLAAELERAAPWRDRRPPGFED